MTSQPAKALKPYQPLLLRAGRVTPDTAYLEIIRLIAIALVLFNHSGESGFLLFLNRAGVPAFLLMALSMLSRCGVPLFFMVSGALLLEKKESIKQTYLRRLPRFLAVLVLFSFMMYCFNVFVADPYRTTFSISEFFKSIYHLHITSPYWFLYSYIAFILALPLLRRLWCALGDGELLLLLTLKVVFDAVFPSLELALGLERLCTLVYSPFTADFILYPLFGCWLANRMKREDFTKKRVLLSIGLSLLCLALTCVAVYFSVISSGDPYTERYYDILRAPIALTLFGLTRAACFRLEFSKKSLLALGVLGNLTFSVYIFEQIFRDCLSFILDGLSPFVGPLFAALVWLLAVFVCGCAVGFGLKCVPGFRRLL